MSRWSWRGYPREQALRDHLCTSDNHPHISPEHVELMTFRQLIAFHEWDHHVRRKNRGRWSTARQVPGTEKDGPYETPTAGKYELPKLPGEEEPRYVIGEPENDTVFTYDGLDQR